MPLDATAVESALSHETDKTWALIMKIDHADLGSPILLALSDDPITSNGDLYQPAAFRVDWPQDHANDAPRVRVAVENTNLDMVVAVRTITSAPSFTMSVVLKSSPDDIQAQAANMTLKNPTWDANWVAGELSYEDIFNAQVGRTFVPAVFPALFKAINLG